MRLRRALHQAVDLILDAIEEERAEGHKKARKPALREPRPMPEGLMPEDVAKALDLLERKGWKRAS